MKIVLQPGFPSPFTLAQVVEAIDEETYRETFKSETSIPNSVQYHLRELVKLGQLKAITPDDVQEATIPVTKPQPGAKTPDAGGRQGLQPSLKIRSDMKDIPISDQGDAGLLPPVPVAISENELRDMAREWYGYGRWDAPYWFIGPEPGQDPSENNDLRLRCAAWLKLGAGELVDCKEHHFGFGWYDWHRETPPPRTQSTWRQLIRLLLATRNGREPSIDDIRTYQQRFWGMKNGETCVIELCSLAANKLKVPKGVDFDAGYFRRERVETIRERIRAFRPAFVVMYRTKDKASWEEIAGVKFSTCPDILRLGSGATQVVFANHPVDKVGVGNAYWLALADQLRERCESLRG